MASERCPGQDLRYWKPEDIGTARCPGCGGEVEIWKDEPERRCPSCGSTVRNPKLDRTCALWCPKAGECAPPEPPVSPGGGAGR
jgi:hypothetical protein